MRKKIKKLWFRYWNNFEMTAVDINTGQSNDMFLGYIFGLIIFPVAFPIYVFFNY